MARRYDPEQMVYREGFKLFLKNRNLNYNQIMNRVKCVFYLWNKRGKDVFWSTVYSDEETLRQVMIETLSNFNPRCIHNISKHMSAFRFFNEYLENSF